MRAFEGRKTEDNGFFMFYDFVWGRGGLIFMICSREGKFWFL